MEVKERDPAVRCPVCTAVCQATGMSYSPREAAAHFCPRERDADRHRRLLQCINRLWSGRDCSIYECVACGFSFGVPFVGGDEEFYSILHEQHGYPGRRWDYDRAVHVGIAPKGGGRVLDIGAGTGVFLKSLPATWSLHAVEGSATTRAVLSDRGICVFESLHEAAADSAGTFDVITMFQVLEHISEFKETLRLCRSLLAPDGMIVITVPEATAMRRQEQLTGCADMPPNHICKWTPQSLAHALRDAGFMPGEAFFEPRSLRSIRGVLHLHILGSRANPRSWASKVYRVRNRKLRVGFLALLSVPAFIRLFPHLLNLTGRTAFGLPARAN